MENFFTSPLLLLCLATHKIFACGTARRNKIGVSGALAFWDKESLVIEDRNDMKFVHTSAKGRQLQLVEWINSKPVMIASTIHIFVSHTEGMEYR